MSNETFYFNNSQTKPHENEVWDKLRDPMIGEEFIDLRLYSLNRQIIYEKAIESKDEAQIVLEKRLIGICKIISVDVNMPYELTIDQIKRLTFNDADADFFDGVLMQLFNRTKVPLLINTLVWVRVY